MILEILGPDYISNTYGPVDHQDNFEGEQSDFIKVVHSCQGQVVNCDLRF